MVWNTPVRWAASDPGWYKGRFVPWLATRGEPDLQAPVRTLLPLALAEHAFRPRALTFAIERWRRMTNDGRMQRLAERLDSAMSWYGTAWLLIAGALLIAFVVYKIVTHHDPPVYTY
jgi:hypothetical protein